jgi:hypothetical protein
MQVTRCRSDTSSYSPRGASSQAHSRSLSFAGNQPSGARPASALARAVFAVERARALFLKRGDVLDTSEQRARRPARRAAVGQPPPPRKLRESLTDPLAGAERIEGPAPSEDASIPAE